MEAEKEDCGPAFALRCKGSQDVYMEEQKETIFNAKDVFLGKRRYQVCYTALQTTVRSDMRATYFAHTKVNHPVTLLKILPATGDLIGNVDLAINNPSNLPINSLIRSISVEFGHQRFDQWAAPDLEGQIAATCALLAPGRRITHNHGVSFIPLVLAPFHTNNLVFPSVKYHDLIVIVQLAEGVGECKLSLYGSVYWLPVGVSARLQDGAHDQMTFQSQFTGAEVLKQGSNTFKLNFNHPVYAIYFWGFDASKVTHVAVHLDGHTFYDGSLAALEHIKASVAPSLAAAAVFFTHDPVGTHTLSSINFSRIDRPTITIETTQEEDSPFYLVGINMQPFRYQNGMVGLKFSK